MAYEGEVVAGQDSSNGQNHHDLPPMGFETLPQANNIEKILEFPQTDDMAGILARGNFKNERQRVAAVRLAYKNAKFHDTGHQQMLRNYVASGLGMQALGKVLQIQSGTNLLVPGVLREILGMKKERHSEQVTRSSDFRERDNSNQIQGGQR